MPKPNDGEGKQVILHEDDMQSHKSFIEAVSTRGCNESAFGYGITTAEPYVRQVLAMEDAGFKSGRPASPEQLIKDARGRLVYANEDMVGEKFASSVEGLDLKDIDVPANTLMLIQHVLTTDREDRDGDVLRTAGAMLDPKAPLLWQHQQFLPIGKVLKTLEQTTDSLKVVSALLDINELTTDVAKLVEAGVLRFSHGFRVLDYDMRKDEDDNETDGFEVKKFEILEASLVSVPSNVDAEIEIYSRGTSDLFKAKAKQLMETKTVTQSSVPEEIEDVEDAAEDEVAKTMREGAESKLGKVVPLEGIPLVITEKGGRVLSQRNYEILKEVAADVAELAGMEISRPAKALCESCANKLQSILDAAKPAEDDDKTEEPEAKDMPAESPDLLDVVHFIISAGESDFAQVKQYVDMIANLDAYSAAGEEYRTFAKST
jgi:HK97 family phage prohead protease